MNDSEALALVPGVAAYRNMRRVKRQTEADDGTHSRLWSQLIGPTTSTALTTGIGAAIGHAVDKEDGALLGGLAGLGTAGVANVLAGIIAAIRRRRTPEEQRAYANSGIGTGAAEYLVPGVAAYNHFKTVGAAMGKDKELKLEDEALRRKLLEGGRVNVSINPKDLKLV